MLIDSLRPAESHPHCEIRPLGWGWLVRFPYGSEIVADDGGPLTYEQCCQAIEAWKMNATKKQADFHIRWIIRRDMPEILGIEAANFEFPWTEKDFHRVLCNRNCVGRVVEHKERIVGFVIYELHKNRLHISSIAVHAAMQRKGVATALIREMHGKLAPHRRKQITLEVRETNLDAQLFFRAMGFKAATLLKDFEENGEDAYLFILKCGEFAR